MSTLERRPMDQRPRGMREILDASFRFVLRHWRPLVIAVLFAVVPLQVLTVLVTSASLPEGAGDNAQIAESVRSGGDVGVFSAGVITVVLLNALTVLLGTAACFKAVADAYLGRRPTWRGSLRFALERLVPVLGLSILYVLGVVLGLLALVLPGIWLAVAWAISYPALLVEEQGVPGALKRSFWLVRRRWWPTFGVVLAGLVLVAIISSIVQFALLVPSLFVDSLLAYFVLSAVAGVAGYAVSTPLQAAIITLTYFDLRIRKEGLDLEQLVERLDEDPPGAGRRRVGGSQSPPASRGTTPPHSPRTLMTSRLARWPSNSQ